MDLVLLTIKWLGHACFLISTAGGSLLLDPYSEKIGYKPLDVKADIVFVSHDHFDHNNVAAVKGKPVVVQPKPETSAEAKKAMRKITRNGGDSRIEVPHDERYGAERGMSTITVAKLNGVRVCHLGDLGDKLTKDQLKSTRSSRRS